MWKTVFIAIGLVLAGCTKRNPAVCCVTPEDCEALGLPLPSRCENGLACDGVNCIEPTCSRPSDCVDPTLPYCVEGICLACDSQGNLGCEPSLPVCDPVSASCVACGGPDDCASHPGAPICSAEGACVACMGPQDCANPMPVCEAGGCRACEADAECSSGACDASGACVEAAAILFVAPSGADAGTCTRDLPCATADYAIEQASSSRFHVVMAPGSYTSGTGYRFPGITQQAIVVHGYGATLRPTLRVAADSHSVFYVSVTSLTVNGLTIEQQPPQMYNIGGSVFRCINGGTLRLRDVRATVAYAGLDARGCEVTIANSSFARNDPEFSWVIAVDGGRFEMTGSRTGRGGIFSNGANITLVNNLITETGISISSGLGTVSFNTIADTSLPSGSARAAECTTLGPMRPDFFHNVIWVPNGTAASMLGTCFSRENIVGPVPQTGSGNLNVDPLFIGNGNYHLRPTSPAIDKAATGPAVDRDGDPRPQGNGYDYGADEVVP